MFNAFATLGALFLSVFIGLPSFAITSETLKSRKPSKGYCRIESFAPPAESTTDFRQCDFLVDRKSTKVESALECKQRAITKGDECLKFAAGAEVNVSGRFNALKFSCAVNDSTDRECP